MNHTLSTALKEWAVVCRALETGRQTLILRKGGIHEAGGVFRPEHDHFWLYPTYEHQRPDQLIPAARPLLDEVNEARPAPGTLRISLIADVHDCRRLETLDAALSLGGLHVWADDVVRDRFHYRTPGLYLLVVRVRRLPLPHELPELAAYAGCRSWVTLRHELSTAGAESVLDDVAYQKALGDVRARLG